MKSAMDYLLARLFSLNGLNLIYMKYKSTRFREDSSNTVNEENTKALPDIQIKTRRI